MSRLVALALLVALGCTGPEPQFRADGTAAVAVGDLRDRRGLLDPTIIPEDELAPVLVVVAPSGPLVLTPADMSTATYQSPPTIVIQRRALTPLQVEALAAQFEVVTWPERAHVATTPEYVDEGIETAAYSRVVLRPDVVLDSRWYTIVGSVLPGQTPPSPKDNPTDFTGKFVSRFFVESAPGVTRVLAAARADELGGDIEIFYSERVRDAAVHAHIRVDVDGRHDTSCRVGNRRALASPAGARLVWLSCDRIAPESHLTITHFQPMRAANGSGVVTAPDGSELGTIEIRLGEGAIVSARSTSDATPLRDAATYVPPFGLDTPGI